MHVIDNDIVASFDVDETLIHWDEANTPDAKWDVEVTHNGVIRRGRINTKHVNRLKMHRFWGNGVVVWSRSGVSFAEAVVKALGIQQDVNVCMSKPFVNYDDTPVAKWLQERYLGGV